MRPLSITLKGHDHRIVPISEREIFLKHTANTYSVIGCSPNQNGIRRMISILCRMPLGVRFRALEKNDICDLTLTWDAVNKEYTLWILTCNFPSRAGWYAGMIHAYNVFHPLKNKRCV